MRQPLHQMHLGSQLLSSNADMGVFIPLLVLGARYRGTCCNHPLARGLSAFSLRTLLIATTLVAVVLGAIVWLRYDR